MNFKNKAGQTPACAAAEDGHHHILKYLFEVGVKPVDESIRVNLLTRSYSNHETYIIVVDEILKISGREGLSKVRSVQLHQNRNRFNMQ